MMFNSSFVTAGTLPAVTNNPVFASSSGYSEIVDDGVQYVTNYTGLSEDQAETIVSGSDVAVYVYDSLGEDTFTNDDKAVEIKNATNKDVVIVYDTSSDVFQPVAVAGDTQEGAILNILTSKGLNAESLQEVVQISEQPANLPVGGEGGNVFLPVGGIFLASVVVASVIAFSRRKGKQPKTVTTNTGSVNVVITDGLPPKIKTLLEQFNTTIRHHHMNQATIQNTLTFAGVQDTDLESLMVSVVKNTQQLFTRLNKRGSNEKTLIATVEYEDKLTKLLEALGDNYYLDIAQDPELWDNTANRLTEVRNAVAQVNTQLVENIRQVNASKDLEFRVVLNALTSTKNNPTVKDIYTTNQGDK